MDEIRTYRQLLAMLQEVPDEKLDQPVQVAGPHIISDEMVVTLRPAIAVGTVEEMEFRYARSSEDNRFHPEELVILIDGNPFGKGGAVAYEQVQGSMKLGEKPIYPTNHSPEADWTGPAQKLLDEHRKDPSKGAYTGYNVAILKKRLNDPVE